MGGVLGDCVGSGRRFPVRPAVSNDRGDVSDLERQRLPSHVVSRWEGVVLRYGRGGGTSAAVSVTTRPTFTFGNPVPMPGIFVDRGQTFERNNDITLAGKRFLGVV